MQAVYLKKAIGSIMLEREPKSTQEQDTQWTWLHVPKKPHALSSFLVQATDTGGANGSIVLPEELNRPENQKLKGIVGKLRKVKEEFDAGAGEQGPIGWADLIYVAGASKD
jgi:hypothetical protein